MKENRQRKSSFSKSVRHEKKIRRRVKVFRLTVGSIASSENADNSLTVVRHTYLIALFVKHFSQCLCIYSILIVKKKTHREKENPQKNQTERINNFGEKKVLTQNRFVSQSFEREPICTMYIEQRQHAAAQKTSDTSDDKLQKRPHTL